MSIREKTIRTLRAYKERHGQPAVRKLLEDTAGVAALSEVPNDLLPAVERAAREGDASDYRSLLSEDRTLNVSAIFAKWNGPRSRAE